MDDTNPYPTLIRINWEIQVNFKKLILIFKDSDLRVVAPIDPLEGHRYVEPVNSEGQGDYLDHRYNIMSSRDDYINPTFDGKLSWRSATPVGLILEKH